MLRNEIETCPYCGTENKFRWDIKRDGYQAACKECGRLLMLCDACKHAEDNEGMQCDWDSETGCFRKTSCKIKMSEPFNRDYTEDERITIGAMLLHEHHAAGKNVAVLKRCISKNPNDGNEMEKEMIVFYSQKMAVIDKLCTDLFN